MKKEIIVFVSNVIALFGALGIAVNFLPFYSQGLISFAATLPAFSSPLEKIETASQQVSLIIGGDETNNNNTAREESSEVMKRVINEDSSDNADLTQTPSDVLALMEAEQQVIGDETVKGKTSEESYSGGGTILAFSNTEIQSKIPPDFYEPDIEALLQAKADLSIKDYSQPTVLIYHSHTTESYTLLDAGFYTESADLKTQDTARNVVRVGDEICRILEEKGIGVLHDTEIHDLSYNAAYDSSHKSVEEYLEQYPSIEITIDVHRDSITYKDGTKVKPTAVVNGKKAARMMIISGCEYGRVKSFESWQDNLRFSAAVTEKVNSAYEGLMRPILFSERRYNMDLTPNSFLLEVGTDANTLEEACYSGRLFASAFADLLIDEYSLQESASAN